MLSPNAAAETEETIKLAKITEDYATCADVALGNFPSDKEAQAAVKLFYKAMISNIEKMLDLEIRADDEVTKLYIDYMGKEIFTGYMLKAFTDVNLRYQTEKKELEEQYNYDWRRVHEELWSKKGCNAIYATFNK